MSALRSDHKVYLPWLVAMALFMEQLDITIVNTAIPAMAQSLQVTPLSLKTVANCYTLSLALCIPLSGWLADRHGTRRVFGFAIVLFTLASVMCGLAVNVPMLLAGRVLQGAGAAMMMPVGRMVIVRTFAKSELIAAMNFVIIPALIGPLLGPTLGGLIVHWFSWRDIFFVNVPVGVAALWMVRRCMPDYRASVPRPLDWQGLMLFGSGVGLLSWQLEALSDSVVHPHTQALLLLSLCLIALYVWHAGRSESPLLNLALLRVRTFRVAVLGGFATRLGIGGMPFLVPMLYQVGLGLPAWQSGLLMVPAALSAMMMKWWGIRLLRRYGHRRVLSVNTVMMGLSIACFGFVTNDTPMPLLILLGAAQGMFNSLQFTSMNSMNYADIEPDRTSMASTLASSMQQLSMAFGLACATILVGWCLSDHDRHNHAEIASALQTTFFALGGITCLTASSFLTLRAGDAAAVSQYQGFSRPGR